MPSQSNDSNYPSTPRKPLVVYVATALVANKPPNNLQGVHKYPCVKLRREGIRRETTEQP